VVPQLSTILYSTAPHGTPRSTYSPQEQLEAPSDLQAMGHVAVMTADSLPAVRVRREAPGQANGDIPL